MDALVFFRVFLNDMTIFCIIKCVSLVGPAAVLVTCPYEFGVSCSLGSAFYFYLAADSTKYIGSILLYLGLASTCYINIMAVSAGCKVLVVIFRERK